MVFECDINRDDRIYKDIENYENHEITYCLAYEMAVRNQQVVINLEKLSDIADKIKSIQNEISPEYANVSPEADFANDLSIILEEPDAIRLEAIKEDYRTLSKSIIDKFYFKLDARDLIYNRKNKKTDNAKLMNHLESITLSRSKIPTCDPIRYRHKPIIPKDKSHRRSIEIDFSLPIEEINSYIHTYMNAYAKLCTSIYLPLDKTREKGIYKKRAVLASKKHKVETVEYPKKTKQQIYADMFFLFDVLRRHNQDSNVAKRYVKNCLQEYYSDYVSDYNPNIASDVKKLIPNSISKINSKTMNNDYESIFSFVEHLKYKDPVSF